MDNVLRRKLYASDVALDVYYCRQCNVLRSASLRLSDSISQKPDSKVRQFLVLKLWPWFGPILAALRCVYTSGFVVDVTFSNNVSE